MIGITLLSAAMENINREKNCKMNSNRIEPTELILWALSLLQASANQDLDITGKERAFSPNTPEQLRVFILSEHVDLQMELSLMKTFKHLLESWERPDYTIDLAHKYFGITEVLLSRHLVLRQLYTTVMDNAAGLSAEADSYLIPKLSEQIVALRACTTIMNTQLREEQLNIVKRLEVELAGRKSDSWFGIDKRYSKPTARRLLMCLGLIDNLVLGLHEFDAGYRKQLANMGILDPTQLSAFGSERMNTATFLLEPLRSLYSEFMKR